MKSPRLVLAVLLALCGCASRQTHVSSSPNPTPSSRASSASYVGLRYLNDSDYPVKGAHEEGGVAVDEPTDDYWFADVADARGQMTWLEKADGYRGQHAYFIVVAVQRLPRLHRGQASIFLGSCPDVKGTPSHDPLEFGIKDARDRVIKL